MAVALPYEVFELSQWARRLRLDDPLPYIRDMALIDADTLRRVGQEAWGVSPALPAEFSAGYGSAAQVELEELARELRRHRDSELSPQWSGIAFEAFLQHSERLLRRLEETSGHFTVVGDVLVTVADTVELSLLEAIGYAVSAAGVVTSITGGAITLATAATGLGAVIGIIIAAVGAIVSIAGFLIANLSMVETRLADLHTAIARLERKYPPGEWVEPQAD